MITLMRYAFSIIIWGIIAIILLWMGKIVYLLFWALLGALLIMFWLGHMIYRVIFLFNPDFKPIKLIVFLVIVVAAATVLFKLFIAPGWNKWGSTPEEIEARYDVDEYCEEPDIRTVRTMEVDVPADYIFRWVRQLPEAGSYGENIFRFRDPIQFKELMDDLPELKEGDRFLIGEIVEVDDGKSITFDIGADPEFPKLGINCMYGGYYFRDVGDDKTRINMVMRADYDGFLGWFYSQVIIEIGDFFITTKQLGKLKKAAEEHFREYS